MAVLQTEGLHPSSCPVVFLLGFNGTYLATLNLELHSSSRKTIHARKRGFAVFSGLPSPRKRSTDSKDLSLLFVVDQENTVAHQCICLRELIRTYILKMALTFPFSFCSQALVFTAKNHSINGYLAYLTF